MKSVFCTLSLIVLASSAAAQPATQLKPQLPSLSLSAEAQRQAANDMARARVYVEMTDANANELARRVNQKVAEVLAVSKTYSAVKTASDGVQTYPVYSKTGGKIESWRMRSNVALESRDIPALAELMGKLQTIASTEQLVLQPSPETERRATDEAMVDALKAFQARAALAASTLGKRYRVKDIAVNQSGNRPPVLYKAARAASFEMSAAAPAPVEAGESMISVTVSGSVELIE